MKTKKEYYKIPKADEKKIISFVKLMVRITNKAKRELEEEQLFISDQYLWDLTVGSSIMYLASRGKIPFLRKKKAMKGRSKK